jgi:GT2 family glycosyltransferase
LDTVLQPGVLQTLSDYFDQHSQVAVVGPQLVNSDGTRQTSCFEFPTPLQTLLRETSLSRFVQASSKFTTATALDKSESAVRVVSWVLGAALAIRRTAFDVVGGFDESYFMYFEEVDLCYRLNQVGWQTHYVPKALVKHVGGASTKSHRASMLQQLYKSLCHFYQQYYSGGQKFQLRLILTYLMLRNIMRDSFRSYRANRKDDMLENVSIWRSILSNIWSANGWLHV